MELAGVVRDIVVLCKRGRLRGFRRSIEDVLGLLVVAGGLLEFCGCEGLLVFVLDDDSFREVKWMLHECE